MTDFGLITAGLLSVTQKPVSDFIHLPDPTVVTQAISTETLPLPVSASSTAPAAERMPEFSERSDKQAAEETAESPLSQVNAVSQLSDVQPTDWAFQSLQSLVERYGCVAGYPDLTHRGDRTITRYEFAAGLNACLNRVNELVAASTLDLVKQEDLVLLKELQQTFAAELASLRGQTDLLEAQVTTLEATQFSTTTRLVGQAIFSIQGSNRAGVDFFPRDRVQERTGKSEITLTDTVQLSLATSFRGDDLLLTTLQTGNLRSSAPQLFTNMARLASESELDNQLVVSDLSYRFAISERLGVIVGAAGVNASNTFRGINPLEGEGQGALSLLGQRNPILAIGNGTGGIGFDWQISRRVSLQGVYSAEVPALAGDRSLGGLFGGRYTAGVQLAIAPANTVDLGIHYLFSHSPDGFLGTGIGDSQLLSPFAPTNSEFNTHAVGATAAWRVNSGWTIGGWGGFTTSKAVNLSGSVETTNWMAFSAFPDLFASGNLGGILVGQPPKITASSLPSDYNFPRFSTDGGADGQPDTSLHLEMFYRARLNSFLDVTPGVLVVFNPNHNAANDTLVIGVMRATFRF